MTFGIAMFDLAISATGVNACCRVRFLLCAIVIGLVLPRATCLGQATRLNSIPFVITTQSDIRDVNTFGTLMICPMHLHGTPENAKKELETLLLSRGRITQPSTIYICQTEQERALQMFAPMVERIVITPYTFYPANLTAAEVWTNSDHPFLNSLRTIRALCPGKQLVARIQPNGERLIFGERAPTFEEIQWQVFAVCGAAFQGISWRGGMNDPKLARRIADLSDAIVSMAPELSMARPVKWVNASTGVLCSALRTKSTLFVILLNPDYLKLYGSTEHRGAELPLDDRPKQSSISLSPPNKLSLVSATNLNGQEINLKQDQGKPLVQCIFRGGGEIIIFKLQGEEDADMVTSMPPVRFPTIPASTQRVTDFSESLLRESGDDKE